METRGHIIFILFILAILLIAPVTAAFPASITNATTTQFADKSYIPWEYEVVIIAMGLCCWGLMKYIEELEVLFGFLAIIVFGVAAYFAAYMAKIESNVLVDSTTGVVTVMYSQYITPQPILQVVLVVCFLFAIVAEVYVVFLREADKKLESTNFVDAEGVRRGKADE
jgi:hypothetical protein